MESRLHSLGLRRATLVVLIAAAAILGGAAVLASRATGHTAAHHVVWDKLTNDVNAARFGSYDGNQTTSRHARDWPITLIFYRNAWVDKVKDAMGYPGTGSTEWEAYRLSYYDHRRFDHDGGRKAYCDRGRDTHFRTYAPHLSDDKSTESLWDPRYGYYVVGSTHYDHGECDGSPHWYGLSEQAEIQVVVDARARGLTVHQDYFDTNNREPERHEGNHYWQNDGLASAIKIP